MNKTMVICENLTKRFDMSAPWLVRKLTGMPKRELVAVDAVRRRDDDPGAELCQLLVEAHVVYVSLHIPFLR